MIGLPKRQGAGLGNAPCLHGGQVLLYDTSDSNWFKRSLISIDMSVGGLGEDIFCGCASAAG
jgi:hypothetical protein